MLTGPKPKCSGGVPKSVELYVRKPNLHEYALEVALPQVVALHRVTRRVGESEVMPLPETARFGRCSK